MAQSSSSQWDRNQKKSKNFQCPCGKSYLSYPALYTHIKQTHGGKAPGQIKRPDTHHRGRPKASGVSRIEQHKKAIQQVLKIDPLPQLLSLVSQAQVSKNRQIRDIYQNQPVFKLIMNDKDRVFEPRYIKQDRVFDVKMGQGIIQFFKQIQNRILDKNIYDQIVMLIVLLTQHIIQQTQDQNVLNLGTIGLMPQFVNYFMIHDFKKPMERLKLQKLWIFQDQNAIRILNVFFKWMLYKKFTLTKVQVNERYFLDEDQIEQNSQSQESDSNQGSKNEQKQGNEQNNSEQQQYDQLNDDLINNSSEKEDQLNMDEPIARLINQQKINEIKQKSLEQVQNDQENDQFDDQFL